MADSDNINKNISISEAIYIVNSINKIKDIIAETRNINWSNTDEAATKYVMIWNKYFNKIRDKKIYNEYSTVIEKVIGPREILTDYINKLDNTIEKYQNYIDENKYNSENDDQVEYFAQMVGKTNIRNNDNTKLSSILDKIDSSKISSIASKINSSKITPNTVRSNKQMISKISCPYNGKMIPMSCLDTPARKICIMKKF